MWNVRKSEMYKRGNVKNLLLRKYGSEKLQNAEKKKGENSSVCHIDYLINKK